MYDLFNTFALFFGVFLGPGVFIGSYWYRRQFKSAIFLWRKPVMVVLSIVFFILNLASFIFGCVFIAGHFEKVNQLAVLTFTSESMLTLGLSCLYLFLGFTFLYFGLQNFFSQYILKEGILINNLVFTKKNIRKHTLKWSQIHDYFIYSDYPLTEYHFIYSNKNKHFLRKVIQVPFYALKRFDCILEHQLEAKNKNTSEIRSVTGDYSQN